MGKKLWSQALLRANIVLVYSIQPFLLQKEWRKYSK